jgi:hypothetical protein
MVHLSALFWLDMEIAGHRGKWSGPAEAQQNEKPKKAKNSRKPTRAERRITCKKKNRTI